MVPDISKPFVHSIYIYTYINININISQCSQWFRFTVYSGVISVLNIVVLHCNPIGTFPNFFWLLTLGEVPAAISPSAPQSSLALEAAWGSDSAKPVGVKMSGICPAPRLPLEPVSVHLVERALCVVDMDTKRYSKFRAASASSLRSSFCRVEALTHWMW